MSGRAELGTSLGDSDQLRLKLARLRPKQTDSGIRSRAVKAQRRNDPTSPHLHLLSPSLSLRGRRATPDHGINSAYGIAAANGASAADRISAAQWMAAAQVAGAHRIAAARSLHPRKVAAARECCRIGVDLMSVSGRSEVDLWGLSGVNLWSIRGRSAVDPESTQRVRAGFVPKRNRMKVEGSS